MVVVSGTCSGDPPWKRTCSSVALFTIYYSSSSLLLSSLISYLVLSSILLPIWEVKNRTRKKSSKTLALFVVSPFLFNHKLWVKNRGKLFQARSYTELLTPSSSNSTCLLCTWYHSNSLLIILALEDVRARDKLKKPVFCTYRKIPKISLSMYRPL